ncbi:uncharacterized protein LOC125201319 [Salvia hispanica]|uniref:uncharacterized protein LOC125201319 n=1 Tax=Salvia hispanica TaxID=49212 RepID=UPI0020099665|nr:uncharacterized protein LOC125201319 [Salvia hispanica]
MSDSETENMSETTNNKNTDSHPNPSPFPAELAAQFAEFLRLSMSSIPNKTPEKTHHPESLGDITVRAKLDGDNYPLWADLMDRAIGGRGLTSHINGVSVPPSRNDPTYQPWQQRDHCVFTWIINNMAADLVNEVSQYATAKDLWDGLAITYGSGADPVQVYDLYRQTNTLKQDEMSLESLWNKFQSLWISIDRREIIPMTKERLRLYQFVTALDDKYESVKKEIIRLDPLPSARKAYARVRRESVNNQIQGIGSSQNPAGLASSLAATARNRSTTGQQATQRPWQKRPDEDRSRLTCTHCGGKKHTKDGCFLLIGFPDWWDEMKRNRATRAAANRGGKVATVVGDRATDAGGTAGSAGATHGGTGNEQRGSEEVVCSTARAMSMSGYQDGDDDWAWH